MLSVKNLTKIYKIKGGADTVALDDVSVDFPETGMVFLLGKSGSGKSTLLNLVGGLDFPTSGEIILKGRSSKDFSQSDFDSYRNTYIGFIFQEYNILNEFNVEQNIALAMELQGKKATKEAVDALLEQVDIAGMGKRKPNTLSGGQKQRIAIARALIKEPNIIMADEPTGALDSKTGEQVFDTLKKLSKDKLVIVVSHDKDFAKRYGDRIIELKDGKIISDRTKHMVDSTAISENVSIINENAIQINDAKKLTKKDFDELYKAIKNSDGKVFISSGENALKSMKAARISEDGRSDVFKTTEGIELKDYDASKTTFIRSKMPMNKSIKMGLSGLKTKPVRLFFTIFLSVISLTMFGVSSSLMLYNPSHSYSEALIKSDYDCEVLRKVSKGKNTYPIYYGDEISGYGSYDDTREEYFGIKEIEGLKNNNQGIKYVPVTQIQYGNSLQFSDNYRGADTDYYGRYGIYYLSDISKEEFDKLGLRLEGEYPSGSNQILLPKIFGERMVKNKDSIITNYRDYINQEISVYNFSGGESKITITGFFDGGDIPSRFDALKTDGGTSLTGREHEQMTTDMEDYFKNSFNGLAFVNEALYNSYETKISRRVDPTYYKEITYGQREEYLSGDISNTSSGFYTDEIVKENSRNFKIFDNNDQPISIDDNFKINNGEVYLSSYDYNEVARQALDSLFQDLYTKVNEYQWGHNKNAFKLFPILKNYVKYHIDEMNGYFYSFKNGDVTSSIDFLNQYKDELDKGYIIERCTQQYMNSTDYSSLDSDTKSLLRKVISYDESESNSLTSDEIQQVYDVLYERFDNACKHYFPAFYFENIQRVEEYREDIYADNSLLELTSKGFNEWTDEDATKAINFINSHNVTYLTESKQFNYMVNGYTFKDYHIISDSTFKADNNAVYYFKSMKADAGTFKVAGYYVIDYNNGCPLLSKEYLDTISDLNTSYGSSTYKTKYEAPSDAKYARVMVKTDFSQGEIDAILNSHDATFAYEFTSAIYESVGFVVSMINTMKQVFLWIGVGFGIFSALMLLNFITVSISSKKKDIGILRAIGARKSDVFKIFFAESLFISAICSLISIIAARIIEFFMDKSFVEDIGISIISFNPLTVVFVVGVALVITIFATLIPVIHSSRKPPVESIRAL